MPILQLPIGLMNYVPQASRERQLEMLSSSENESRMKKAAQCLLTW